MFHLIPYASFLSKTCFLLHPLPTLARLICLPCLGLHSTPLQLAGELLLPPAALSAGVRKKCWRRAGSDGKEKALLSRTSSTAPSRHPARRSTVQSWPRDRVEGPGGQGGWWRDAGASRPAARRASSRRSRRSRRSCHLHAEPRACPSPPGWLRAVALTAPTHKSPRPQFSALTPACPVASPAPLPATAEGGSDLALRGPPATLPAQAAAADSRRRRAADARARRRAPAPEHPLRAHWVRRRGREGKRGGLADSLADPGSCP